MESTLEAQGWTPTSFDTYRSAVLDEGNQTLSVVTEHLYEGGNTRPDVYFKSKFSEEKYKRTFNRDQQFLLEHSGGFFNIGTAVEDYDISLNFLLQEHVCGLASKGARHWQMQGTFENMLNQVHKKRNEVSHNSVPMNGYQLKERLLNLQELYGDILNYVDSKTYCNIVSVRLRIMNSLKDKFPDGDDQDNCFGNQIMHRLRNNVQPSYFGSSTINNGRSNSDMPYKGEEEMESGIPTVGKIALGVGAAAFAAWGVSKMIDNNKSSEQEKRRKQKSSNEDECSIM